MNDESTPVEDLSLGQVADDGGEPDSLIRFLLDRSQVRVFVTHLMAWTFALAALGMILWFLRQQKDQEAMTVFSHVVALVGPIVGFWFGARGRKGERDEGNNTPSAGGK